jgi:catechol 2,3-dioxygenase-like lactoylglutathione lyase family enzyme
MTQPPFSQQITFLNTGNLAETTRFYEEILQLPLALDQGTCRIYRASPDGYLGFCQNAEALQRTQGVILTLVTPEVDDWYRCLCRRGIAFEKAPAHNPRYNIYHCFLRDPNGYLIEIQRFEDPRWSPSTDSSSTSNKQAAL